jgi:lipopolysaccharide/colanic/teichoic acid biosynthesis glycosyltransferase
VGIRRGLDVVGTFLAVIILAPVLAIISCVILVCDGMPIMFGQVRVGRHGKPFMLWKFRTMNVVSKGRAPEITARQDPRVTMVGEILRRYRLDELPQFANILVGDMSVVGPRPEVPLLFERYPKYAKAKLLSVRPGLTDCATLGSVDELMFAGPCEIDDIEERYLSAVVPAKVELALKCIERRDVVHYLGDILRTIGWLVRQSRGSAQNVR